jgi:outer membrane phospholipase A
MLRATFHRRISLAAMAALAATALQAQEPPATPPATKPKGDDSVGTLIFGVRYFRPYEDNYMLYQQMDNRGWAERDESAFRGHYSFKYSLLCRPRPETPDETSSRKYRNECDDTNELFLFYTGAFDFYMGTRPSGPVINRLSNPGLQWRMPWRRRFDLGAMAPSNVSIGLEHMSNGQTIEVGSPRDIEAAQRAYEARDRVYFDQISRGVDFVSLGADWQSDRGLGPSGKLQLRHYLHQDTDVTWGPRARDQPRLADYQRATMLVRYAWSDSLAFETRWTVGDRGLKTDSWDFGVQLTLGNHVIPLYFHVHHGPLNTLSNYTQRQDSIGIGLRFSHFDEHDQPAKAKP